MAKYFIILFTLYIMTGNFHLHNEKFVSSLKVENDERLKCLAKSIYIV